MVVTRGWGIGKGEIREGKNKNEMLEIKNTATKIKNTFDWHIGTGCSQENSESLCLQIDETSWSDFF